MNQRIVSRGTPERGRSCLQHPPKARTARKADGPLQQRELAANRNVRAPVTLSEHANADCRLLDTIANHCGSGLHSGMIRPFTGASWILTAMGAGYGMAEIPPPASPMTNLLEIRSLIVDGKPFESQ